MTERSAVVVGATGNLGSAVAQGLSRSGWAVDQTWLKAERPNVRDRGAFDTIPRQFDAGIYCAGANLVKDLAEISDDEWEEVIDINLSAAFRFARRASQSISDGGTLIFIGSIMATHPYPKRTPYAAAKAGLEGLGRALAVDLGGRGIRVHVIRLGHLPGLMKSTSTQTDLLSRVAEVSALGTMIDTAGVASFVSWLCSEQASTFTSGVHELDNGYVRNRWPLL